jgi:hypothetical protein
VGVKTARPQPTYGCARHTMTAERGDDTWQPALGAIEVGFFVSIIQRGIAPTARLSSQVCDGLDSESLWNGSHPHARRSVASSRSDKRKTIGRSSLGQPREILPYTKERRLTLAHRTSTLVSHYRGCCEGQRDYIRSSLTPAKYPVNDG